MALVALSYGSPSSASVVWVAGLRTLLLAPEAGMALTVLGRVVEAAALPGAEAVMAAPAS
jgi:hypothetical protein